MKICKFLAASSLLLLLWSPLAHGVDYVALGSDYFQTNAGTSFNFGSPIGVVNFMGSPIGPGLTDTIVQRLNDVPIGGSGPIQITALSLVSTAPVTFGGTTYNVSVGLASNPMGSQDMGTINISGALSGGTFTSTLDVFFDVHFSPISGPGAAFDVVNDAMLMNAGASWGPAPAAGQVIVPGFDCDDPNNCTRTQMAADQAANQHSGLSSGPGAAGGPPAEVDFFVPGTFQECKSDGSACHVVGPAPVPEPATMLLLGFSLIGLAGVRRKFKK